MRIRSISVSAIGGSWLFCLLVANHLLISFTVPASAAVSAAWDGSTGNWSDATHWSTNPVFPNNSGGTTYQASMSAGSLTLDHPITVDSFSISGGTFIAQNNLNLPIRFEATGGTSNFGPGGSLSTPLLKISAGAVNFNYDLVLPPTQLSGDRLSGATLGGSGNFTVMDGFDWSGGSMAGTGTTTFFGNRSILNTPNTLRTQRNIRNVGGILDWRATGPNAYMDLERGATFTNAADATFIVHGGIHIVGDNHGSPGFFLNEGDFIVDGGTSSSGFQVPFRNSGEVRALSGTLAFTSGFRQTGGSIDLRGVTFIDGSHEDCTAIFDGGSVVGATTFACPLINSTMMSVGSPIGEIRASDSVRLLNDSRLMLELGGRMKAIQYDSLMAETIDLGGKLDIRFARGFETSILGSDSFNIISTQQLPFGNFDNVSDGRLATSDGLGSFKVIINGTGVTLTDFQAVPEPAALFSMAASAVMFLTRRRSG